MLKWLFSSHSVEEQQQQPQETHDNAAVTHEAYANLYEESTECLFAALSIYGIADVRALAAGAGASKKGKEANLESKEFSALQDLLVLPKTRTDLVKALLRHEEDIKAQASLDTAMYMTALEQLVPMMNQGLQQQDATFKDPVELVVFDDELSDVELVYCIVVDKARKVIRLTFRGSTTVTDWAHDADIRMEEIDNPLRIMDERDGKDPEKGGTIRQSRKIGLHAGFRKYLFSSTKASIDGEKVPRSPVIESLLPAKVIASGEHCKYDCILRHLLGLLELHPGFTIQVTGHSLGAALATLCAFCLACEDSMPLVTCISFASPRLANGNFGRAFQELELRGRLRNLRVANAEDVVTATPDTTFSFTFVSHLFRKNFFLHTGACLTLRAKVEADSDEAEPNDGNEAVEGVEQNETTSIQDDQSGDDETDSKQEKKKKQPLKTEIIYPRVSATKDEALKNDWKHRTENLTARAITLNRAFTGQADFLKWHSCEEYLARLREAQVLLGPMTFKSLYAEYFANIEE